MVKGSDAERALFNKLWNKGYAVMRSPASGSGRKHPQPDLLVSAGGNFMGLECKSSSSDSIYIPKEELNKLRKFCERFGAFPIIAVRFDNMEWKFLRLGKLEDTGKSLKVTRGLAESEGVGLSVF